MESKSSARVLVLIASTVYAFTQKQELKYSFFLYATFKLNLSDTCTILLVLGVPD